MLARPELAPDSSCPGRLGINDLGSGQKKGTACARSQIIARRETEVFKIITHFIIIKPQIWASKHKGKHERHNFNLIASAPVWHMNCI